GHRSPVLLRPPVSAQVGLLRPANYVIIAQPARLSDNPRPRTSTSTSTRTTTRTTTTIPVALDTDIGTDIDDVYALILAAVSPELDLKAVTTVNNDTNLRARLAKAVLSLLEKNDIPVAAGARESLTPGVSLGWMGHEGQGI